MHCRDRKTSNRLPFIFTKKKKTNITYRKLSENSKKQNRGDADIYWYLIHLAKPQRSKVKFKHFCILHGFVCGTLNHKIRKIRDIS